MGMIIGAAIGAAAGAILGFVVALSSDAITLVPGVFGGGAIGAFVLAIVGAKMGMGD